MEPETSGKTKIAAYTVFDLVGFIAICVIAIAVLAGFLHNSLQYLFPKLPDSVWIAIVAAFIAVLIAAHFIVVFTRYLPNNVTGTSNHNNKSLSPQLRSVFIYGYVFMLGALGLCAAPFLIPIDKVGDSSETSLAAGVVIGCRSDACDEADRDPQWYVHIGSKISMRGGTTDGTAEPAQQPAEPVQQLPEPTSPVLQGGLVVPLYILVLALMGGAVSMIRRIPEYQKQVVGEKNSGPALMTPIRARELIVFQIMQVFSAPLIAITAFAVFAPDTAMSGALFGFVSGFASETILLRLRAAADALSRKTPSDSPTESGAKSPKDNKKNETAGG